jgi:hypothetical protein
VADSERQAMHDSRFFILNILIFSRELVERCTAGVGAHRPGNAIP